MMPSFMFVRPIVLKKLKRMHLRTHARTDRSLLNNVDMTELFQVVGGTSLRARDTIGFDLKTKWVVMEL